MRTDDTYGISPLQPVLSYVEFERQILQAICQSLSVPKSVMNCVSFPVETRRESQLVKGSDLPVPLGSQRSFD